MGQQNQQSALDDYLKVFPWVPQEGPQTNAFFSEADLILYGGAAGGGKTALAVGLACTLHRETLFVRKESTQLTSVIDYVAEVNGTRDGYNGQDKVFRLKPWDGVGRKILFGSCPNLGDETKYQGRPRDLLVIDEAANMLEDQVRFLMGWVRTTVPGQKCRTLLCSNPPTSSEGEWLIRMFAPWLDPAHDDPAAPGELRWFATVAGEEVSRPNGDTFEVEGEMYPIKPQSRTFIPARITDNQYLVETGYMATLQALPEPLRSQMLKGDFLAGRDDDEYQVIPSDWVAQAQARWESRDFVPSNISSAGIDPSRGGKDETCVAYKEGPYFHPIRKWPGHKMPTGGAVARAVLDEVGETDCPLYVDVIGIGASVVDSLDMIVPGRTIAVNAAAKGNGKDWSGTLNFQNKRAELWWRFRDLLNPANGQNIALPPDAALQAELCAPRYTISTSGVKIEGKKDIKKRIGRSTDTADAVLMAAAKGTSGSLTILGWQRPINVERGID